MMTIREVMEIVDGKVLVGEDRLDTPVETACGSDLMSDVLAFVKEKTVLITGLINPHVVRTSEMLDITCIVFSRGKMPSEEILEMAERTKAEFSSMGTAVAGDGFVGSGETFALKKVTDLMAQIREDHPGIRFQIYSGNAEDVMERLERGLLDFGVLVEPADVSRYNSLRLPAKDTWGLVLRRDHPLAQKKHIRREDLTGIPLIMSRQDMASQKAGNDYLDWFGKTYESLNIVAGYSLMYNGALMVKSGIGCAVGLDQVVNTTETSDLCFRPFDPPLEAGIVVIWKKYQVFSKPAEMLLERMMGVFGE